jgi:hypothetical protein
MQNNAESGMELDIRFAMEIYVFNKLAGMRRSTEWLYERAFRGPSGWGDIRNA